jgi:hypothetical protein
MSDENRGMELPLPSTVKYDEAGGFMWDAATPGLMVADTHSGDGPRLRGWGYLTGVGGLNLSVEEAADYQDRIGRRMQLCWNLCSAVGLSDDELKVMLDAPPEVLREIMQRRTEGS